MSQEAGTAESNVLEQNRAIFDAWFNERFDQKIAAEKRESNASICMMVTRGTLDWAYPPFIIASTASALGWDVTMFFTFYGLNLLKKRMDLKLSGLGNPAMPMKMPFGPDWFRDVEWNIPNLVMANIPGFENLAGSLMKKTLSDKGVAPVAELRQLCLEAEVRMIACQMTVDLFGWPKSEFIDGVSEWAGAATYLSHAQEARVNLFM